ncbi:MAG: FMN-binding glutamate synthase family protein [Bacteroidetes bacterium]|nr:MAG: FMN-binding glutamate synthase family protein [Bacteroidota bacterium]
MQEVVSFLGGIAWWVWVLIVVGLVALRDVLQRRHTISHNFPVVGHFRYMLETIGPEIRQYFIANNREELPFNRRERSWIYASAKAENNYQGFGSDQDFYATNYHFLKPDMFPYKMQEGHINLEQPDFLPCAKIMGKANGRKRPFRPRSVINVSAMSFGSLSANAVESLNKGAHKAGAYHNTGEGGLSPYHSTGSDVVFHFGTGYFGVRSNDGNLDLDKLEKLVENNQFVRAIEIKLSQGAKPGKGGVLPGKKITAEIAAIRGVELGKDVLSPASHKCFETLDELLSLIEEIAKRTGLPVGIKSAIGKTHMWEELASKIVANGSGPDFITIDGGEGGTGAAPPSFADHVALPFFNAFSVIYKIFQKQKLTDGIVFVASGKLGLPANAARAFAMGADVINVAREAMMSIGCIQAQLCHTNNCPSGVATQNKWLQAGIDPTLKSERFYNYVKYFRKELVELTHASGYEHPCQYEMSDVETTTDDRNQISTLADIYGYTKDKVSFNSMNELLNCPYLGSSTKSFK